VRTILVSLPRGVGPRPKPRCEVCKGSFGLIRHRLAFKQFCSKRCLDQYLATRKHLFDLKQWADLARG
jgi:hypothetical protein